MVVLAQALVSEPRFVIIDELSLGLAPVIVQRLIPTIREHRRSGDRRAPDRAVRDGRARPRQPRLRDGGRPDPVLGRGAGAARQSRAAALGIPAARDATSGAPVGRRADTQPANERHRDGARAGAHRRHRAGARVLRARARPARRRATAARVHRLLAVRGRHALPAHRRPRRHIEPTRRRSGCDVRDAATAGPGGSHRFRGPRLRRGRRAGSRDSGSRRSATTSPGAARDSCSSRTRTGCGSRSTSRLRRPRRGTDD